MTDNASVVDATCFTTTQPAERVNKGSAVPKHVNQSAMIRLTLKAIDEAPDGVVAGNCEMPWFAR